MCACVWVGALIRTLSACSDENTTPFTVDWLKLVVLDTLVEQLKDLEQPLLNTSRALTSDADVSGAAGSGVSMNAKASATRRPKRSPTQSRPQHSCASSSHPTATPVVPIAKHPSPKTTDGPQAVRRNPRLSR